MSTADQILRSIQNTIPRTSKARTALAIITVAFVGIAVVAMMRGPKPPASADKSEEKEESAHAIVTLSQNKLRSVQLHVTPCQIRELRDLRTVPGKITYNESQYLEIKAPAGAVVKQVLVTPEQPVKKGDRLAVLSSSEIGLARDAVAQCKSDLVLAQREADRTEQIATNLAALLDLLKQHPEPAQIEKQFDDRVLGEHRQQIVSTYSKLFLAEAVTDNLGPLEDSKAVSGRVLQERRSDREVAKAAFATACEQARFEISQDREKSQAKMQHAERMLSVCRQRLDSLGVTRQRFYVMGQVCVGKPWRGKGVFDLLYQAHRRHLRARFDCSVTEVAMRNTRSLRAHERVGFTVIDRYRDQTDDWAVIRWDWSDPPRR